MLERTHDIVGTKTTWKTEEGFGQSESEGTRLGKPLKARYLDTSRLELTLDLDPV